MEYYLAIKKNEIMPFVATWMDLKTIILSEASHTGKDKYINSVWNLKKKIQMNIFTKQIHRHRKQTYGYQGGKKGEK